MPVHSIICIIILDDELDLPAGTDVAVFIPGIHRNPKNYPNPDKYDPDRFLPEKAKERHQYSFLPFSAGTRNCIGFKFGLIETKVMVARILHNFNVKTTDKVNDVALLPETVIMPERGYNFILENRKKEQ